MKITYIYHSCYEVITDRYQLIFDYYKGDLHLLDDRETIFFVSHSHKDHYNSRVHELADHVVLWEEIPYRDDKTVPLGVRKEMTLGDLLIKTSGSTDEGLSFDIELDGVRLIFAGDLNDWNWPDDTPQEEEAMHQHFLRELSSFKENPDILFFPVDYRIEDNYDKGVNEAIRSLKPRLLCPLHFTAHPEILPVFKENVKDKVRVILPEETPFCFEGNQR